MKINKKVNVKIDRKFFRFRVLTFEKFHLEFFFSVIKEDIKIKLRCKFDQKNWTVKQNPQLYI